MAAEPGGRADKFGNRYERLWAVRQLLLVSAGEVRSVLVEGLGDDQRGVDIWVVTSSGIREGHQCKRENGTKGKWTVADLNREGILENAKFQLDRDPNYRFAIVSSDAPILLRDLSERTTHCNSDPEAFYLHQVQTSAPHLREFEQVCRYLGYGPDSEAGRRQAFDLLRRLDYRPFDKIRCEDNVKRLARLHVNGSPATAIDALSGLVEANLGNELGLNEIRCALRDRELSLRNLRGDAETAAGIDRLCKRFLRGYTPLLIDGKLLPRDETKELRRQLLDPNGPKIILVHGSSGAGKSGVVFELCQHLQADGIPNLALRLDRQKPSGTTDSFGQAGCGLPASPVACLSAIAPQQGILILDQVDAIRWTSAHSSNAWDVTEELIDEAIAASNLRIVVVCRTFDLTDDIRIGNWKEEYGATELPIAELTDVALTEFLTDRGLQKLPLSPQQRKLLRSPLLLNLWWALQQKADLSSRFRTATDLMRSFWIDRRERLREIGDATDSDQVLEHLAAYMDRESTLAAPESLVEQWNASLRALISVGVLTRDDHHLIFAHQSYFDYLLASRVNRDVLRGTGKVLGWLLTGDQSLFRRGQLRILLDLLRDDDAGRHNSTLRDILSDKAVRFHLKHLTLQILGQADTPTPAEIDLVLDLVASVAWRDHVWRLVLWNKPAWFNALYDRGIIREWLASDKLWAINFATWMMSSVGEVSIERISEALTPMIPAADALVPRLANVLFRIPPHLLPPHLFKEYCRLVKTEQMSPWMVRWEDLSKASPGRCIRLFATWIRREIANLRRTSEPGEPTRVPPDEDRPDNMAAITESAEREPVLAWKLLMPVFVRLHAARRRGRNRIRESPFNARDWGTDQKCKRLLRNLESLLVAAGSALAKSAPRQLWHRISRLPKPRQKSVERVIALSLSAITGPVAANRAVEWLLAKRRLHLGSDQTRDSIPARSVFERLGKLLDRRTIARIESSIFGYRSRYEKASYRVKAQGHMSLNHYGLGQYLLLSALPPDLLSAPSLDFLGVLERKFGNINNWLKDREKSRGGFVGTSIPAAAMHRLSDKQWLQLVSTNWAEQRSGYRQIAPGQIARMEPDTIQRDLGRAAAMEPSRFARLALRFPMNAPSIYFAAVLDGLAKTKAPDGTPEPIASTWQQANREDTETFLHSIGFPRPRDTAISFCRLLEARCSDNWSDEVFQMLVRIGTDHPDPAADEYAVSRGETPDIPMSGTNCVRGCAAGAIAALLFYSPNRRPLLQPAIDALLNDHSPAVRAAAIQICLPLINFSRDEAASCFVHLGINSDRRVLLSHYTDEVLSYLVASHWSILSPIVQRMIASSEKELKKRGAAWATLSWIRLQQPDGLMVACIDATTSHRAGVAEVLSANIAHADEKLRSSAFDRLCRLLDDTDSEVRNTAIAAFDWKGFYSLHDAPARCLSLVSTQTFRDDPYWLLESLHEQAVDIVAFSKVVFAVCDTITGPLLEMVRDASKGMGRDIKQLGSLLLRLYEQAEGDHNVDLRNRVLDHWDKLLESGAGFDTMESMDR